MFTGIIKEIGKVRSLESSGLLHELVVESPTIHNDVEVGDSVSVSGVCLTVVNKKGNVLSFDVTDETLARSVLADIGTSDLVNLENALKADSKIGGHFVQGHVDCVALIKNVSGKDGNYRIEIGLPKEFGYLLIEKGSIAIDGISLTVGEVENSSFTVYVIPHTLSHTTLKGKKAGDKVNLEFDVLGKYVAKMLGRYRESCNITEDFLSAHGFRE